MPQTCVPPSQPETIRASDDVLALPFGHSLLQGQYRIERELMAGGFGITYLARDSLDRQVVIKECFPAGFCIREGAKVATHSPYRAKSFKNVLRHFLREAQWLARAQHDNIVTVHQVFKENGTAYIAMECIEGCDLVTLRAENSARLDQELLSHLLDQALLAVSGLHAQGILHRDLSPDNFLIDAADHLTLIDFGAACGVHGGADTALGAMLSVKDGYSPHEFYQPDMPQRLSSDLYALGATFHFLITGMPPADAQARLKAVTAGYDDPCPLLEEGDWPFAADFLRAVDKSMSILPGMRFQSVEEWADSLAAETPAPVVAQPAAPVATLPDAPAPDAVAPAVPETVISDLVAATNKQVKPGQPAQSASPALLVTVPKKPAQMVDMFGEPIGDVDQWLETQDQMARRAMDEVADKTTPPRRAEHRSPPPPAVAAHAPKPETKAEKRARETGWVDRVARIWGADTRTNAMTVNGKTT
nr:serine/threonine-protein kinase [Epibacterium ulvae]